MCWNLNVNRLSARVRHLQQECPIPGEAADYLGTILLSNEKLVHLLTLPE